MGDPLELTPPPSLGNLPASLPFAISMERTFLAQGCESSLLALFAGFLARSYAA